jgi:hypothetical protein
MTACYSAFLWVGITDNDMNKKKQLNEIFGDATNILKRALSPDPEGETTNECYILLKDLAHCGGNSPSPISIMKAGTVFKKKVDSEYFSDGFHLIARHVAEWSKDYFIHLTESEGNAL